MILSRTVLAGVAMSALMTAAPNAFADDWDLNVLDHHVLDQHILNQQIDIGVGNALGGFGDSNAVAVAALQQSAVQTATSSFASAIDGSISAGMSFGELSFSNQSFNNNNFNSGVNAVQGNAMAIAMSFQGGGGPAPADLGQ